MPETERNPGKYHSAVEALRNAEVFKTLPNELLRKIAGFASIRKLEAGEVLFSEYEEASALYVVAGGELRLIRQSADGREQVLSTDSAGGVLAVVPLFNGGKFFSTSVADVSSEVIVIEKHHVHQLCREHPELLWNVARVLALQVRSYARLIESLALRTVEQRVAEYIFSIASERGEPAGEGCAVELTLTHGEIASRIGSTREGVSRIFAQLQKSGLIHVSGRKVIIVPDMRALSEHADIQPVP